MTRALCPRYFFAVAVCAIRARTSINSRSTILRRRAVWCRSRPSRYWAARSATSLWNKIKAAGSYARAINIRPRDEAARIGFARAGGKPGQSNDTF
jgi:hypothetical protein